MEAILRHISLDMSLLVETIVHFFSENLALHLRGREVWILQTSAQGKRERGRCTKQHSEEVKGYIKKKPFVLLQKFSILIVLIEEPKRYRREKSVDYA